MTTAFQSFDKSPLDAYVKSPLDARNAPGGKVLYYDKVTTAGAENVEDVIIPVLTGERGMYHGLTVHAILPGSQYEWTGSIDDYALIHLNYRSFAVGSFPVPIEELFSGHRAILYEDDQGEDSFRPKPHRQVFATASGLRLELTPPIDPLPRNVFYPPNVDSIAAKGMTLGFLHQAVYGNAFGGTPLHVRPDGLPVGLGYNDAEIVRDGVLYVYACELGSYSVSSSTQWPNGASGDYQTFAKNLIEFGA